MSGILSAMSASAGTLATLERELQVTENNVSNASTPGYADQISLVSALSFDTNVGSAGGVQFVGTQSLRNEASEHFVQQQNSGLGNAQAQANSLSALQPSFDITGNSGIDAAFTSFFNSFSALSQDPSSIPARQQVLTTAQNAASAFNDVASATSQASGAADQQIATTVSQINTIAGQLQQFNQQKIISPGADPNLDASVHSALQNLSNLVNFTSSFAQNGTVTVLVDGQTPLVIGGNVYPVTNGLAPSIANPTEPYGTPAQVIRNADGSDITNQITGGQLSGLLQVRNVTLAGIQGDTTQPGSLNQLAQTFATQVNSLLTSGQSASGPPAVAGVPLFQFDPNNADGAAASLSITSITAQQIATISPGPPFTANGIAQQISDLPTTTNPTQQVNGMTMTAYYASIASSFGQQLSNANSLQTQQTQSLAQAQSLLNQTSGVSLDQEAVNLTNFQQAYQATSKLVSVLSSLTETTINLIQ
jgi:flagellar hook-associated protein 1 FlgK